MIDIERIKTEIPIEELVAKSFTVTGSGHTLTTEEHDSLKLFTRNNTFTWYSHAGRNGKALGGSVIDWYQHMHQCSTKEAIRALSAMLDGGALPALPAARVVERSAPNEDSDPWRDELWQKQAQDTLPVWQDILWNQDAGQPGRDYLAGRGIRLDTAIHYGIGYNPIERWEERAAWGLPQELNSKGNPKKVWFPRGLVLPWQRQQITALKFREIDKKNYPFVAGSRQYLFGAQHLFALYPDWKAHTLIVREGEICCMSIAQVIRDMGLPVDVVSIGSQGVNEKAKQSLKVISPRYRHFIAWADEPGAARAVRDCLPPETLAIQSPGGKDANDLLQAGLLEDFVWSLIQEIDSHD